VHRALAMVALATAACSRIGCSGKGDGRPLVACSADAAVVPVGQAVTVRCVATRGSEGPVWSVQPAPGSLSPEPDGCASFTVATASVGPAFGDTTFQVKATYRNAAGETVGLVAVTALGNTWIARNDTAAVQAVASDGTSVGALIPLQGTAGPVLALAARADGAVLAGQSPQSGEPVRVHDRAGAALGAFDAADAGGRPLFDAAAPPRAIQQMRDGTVWVTGGQRPVIYEAGGRFRSLDAKATAETIGLVQLPDGRVAVTYRYANAVGFYDESGATLVIKALQAVAPAGESYDALGALAASPDGLLVLAAAHFSATGWSGTLLRLDGELLLEAELPPVARVPRNVPWALALTGAALDTGPSPVTGDTAPACPRRFMADLSGTAGCLDADTAWQAVVHLGPLPAGAP
jgi:hypothetical protein